MMSERKLRPAELQTRKHRVFKGKQATFPPLFFFFLSRVRSILSTQLSADMCTMRGKRHPVRLCLAR